MYNKKVKVYKILIVLLVMIMAGIGIVKQSNIDKNYGKVNIKEVYVTKTLASVSEANIKNEENIKATDEIKYEIKYKIDGKEKRNVVVEASLRENESKYASFEEIENENIKSTLNEDKSNIKIEIKEVEPNILQTLNLYLIVKNAPNNFKINPSIKIKEATEEKYDTINTKETVVKTKSITGIIRDETKNGVSNLEIKLVKDNEEVKRTYTDKEGKYTFSDIEEGTYKVDVVEDKYEIIENKNVEVKESEVLDLIVREIKPFNIEVKKYIQKVTINNKTYTYNKINKVNQSVKNLKEINGEIEYKVVIKNIGKKEGIVTKVEESLPEGLKLKEKNGWKNKNGKIRNEEVEGITLKPGEEKELKLEADIEKTKEAKSYLSRVTVKGEIYEKVTYIVNDKIYKNEEVLEGEKIKEISMPDENGIKFSGWYTDKNYTNKYNFDLEVTKDMILYGKYEEKVKKYNVIFIDEGNVIKKEGVLEGTIIDTPKEPEKEGYTFKGWYLDNDEEYNLLNPVTKDLTLYSKYEINKYDVVFKNEDGSILQSEKEEYNSYPVYKKETPIKVSDEEYNYEFIGWDKKIEKVTGNQEYTAKYKKIKRIYKVTYIYDGNEEVEEYEYGSVVLEKIKEKEGYTFDGWYENLEKVIFPLTVTRNITLTSKYEKNKYVVTFYNENEEEITKEEVEHGERIKNVPNTNKKYYRFVGWYEKGETEKFDLTKEIKKNTNLYAKYEVIKYTVRFYDNNKVINEKTEYEAGSMINIPSDPEKEGYTFKGWYKEGEDEEYNFVDNLVTEDVDLYSKYEINKYKVEYYDANPETKKEEKVGSEEVEYNKEVGKIEEIEGQIGKKTGYTLVGWIKENKEEFVRSEKIKENIKLYTKYVEVKNGVIFDDEGRIETKEVQEGKTVDKIESKGKEGYTFKYWSKDKINEFDFNTPILETITLYAVYEINSYTLTVNPNGGMYNGSAETKTYTLNYGEEKIVENPTKEGYTFTGWTVSKENVLENNIVTMPSSDVTLEANYEINSYTLTVNPNGGMYNGSAETKTYTLNYGEEKIVENPTKEGYTFTGWTVSKENVLENNIVTMPSSDVTLEANYEINKYTVVFKNYDGEELQKEVLEYGTLPVYKANNPVKEKTKEYTYNFTGWDKEIEEVTDNQEYVATYESIKNKYTVVFKNYDGEKLQKETLEYGTLPVYKANNPVREKTKEYTYNFTGWDKEIEEVTDNQEYVATYESIKNKYTISFVNYDGEELQKEMLEYGTLPVYKANDPVRENTKEYTYNFTGWNSEIEEVTDNKVYVAVFSETKNEYTVTFKDNDEVYGTKKVEYGKTVEEISPRPSKGNNIFRGWKKENEEEYDFSEIVTEDITLISYYEEVEKPVISHESIDWTNDKVMVTITNDNHPEYSFKYKIGNGEYKEYTGPFEVLENSVVTAKSIKENVESIIETHEIKNIDKIKPSITSIEETSITPTSATVIINGIDNESGVKEIKLYKENNGQYEELISNEYNLKEASLTYTINNLEELTTYKLKVEIIDNATNVYVEEKEVTTTEKIIVAKIVGRNGTLNKDLIEKEKNDIGESITEEQIKEIEEKYPDEKYENLESAIEACNNNQCTIEMVLDTNESVDILDMQDVTLDLNGKTVTGTRDYTILNSGKLIIKDLGETVGSITNENAVSIKNTGTLTLGELEEEVEVSTTKPNIVGNTSGIETSGTFNFYDGRIEGIAAVSGTVTKTPYLYNARVESGAKQVATLTILAEAEARINTTYYTKVSNAMNEAKKGYYDEETETVQNLTKITKENKDTEYGFKYDEETGKLISTNQGVLNSVSNSYIKIDLTNYTEDQKLTVNAEISCRDGNYDVGYATITNSIDVPTYDNSTGRFIYIYGEVAAKNYQITLSPGKIYYLHLGYRKYPYSGDNVRNDTFTINSIKLEQIEAGKLITSNTYGFKYNEETGTLTNTNQGIQNSVSNSYVKLDLTKETEDKTLVVNAQISSEYSDFGYATVTESDTVPTYNNSTGRFIQISQEVSATDYQTTLSKGKIYYLHLGYRKDSSADRGEDTFTINSIKYSDGADVIKGFGTTLTDYTNITKIPVLNEEPDTIELLKNITLSSPMEIEDTRDVVLDLRGQTLTTQTTDYVVKNHGNLKIIDSKYTDDIDSAQKKYEEEEAQNQLEYENALSEYDTYKNQTQNSYNEEYKEKLNNEISSKSELKTKQEEYEKKLKEYNDSHYEFDYTGDVQTFTIPETGKYKVELWGASGGIVSDSSKQARGGYTSGEITLNKGDILYVYVGEQGSSSKSQSYNGGGSGGNTNHYSSNAKTGNSGGGATDIRLVKGISWNDFISLKSRIMVAGASGGSSGATLYESAGSYSAAGGLIGYDGGYYSGHYNLNQNGKGATQVSGGEAGNNIYSATGETNAGSFGSGGDNESISDETGAGGGGGGYYGGGAGGGTQSAGYGQGAGGGSSFISGHDGCDAISEDSTENNIVHTGQSIHYSNYSFENTKIVDGLGYNWTTEKSIQTGMPTHDGTSIMNGNKGNGYAKITKLDANGNEITKPTPVTNGYSTDDYVQDELLMQVDALSNESLSKMQDVSGNGNNGTMNNVTKKDNAFVFNGNNSYVDFGKATDIGFIDNHSITIDMLISFTQSQTTNVILNTHNDNQGGFALGLENNSGNANKIKLHANSYSGNRVVSNKTLNDGNLHHLVGIIDFETKKMKIYIDGVLDNSTDLTTNLNYTTHNLIMGRWYGGGYYYNGNVYNAKIYNKVLTEEEIQQNYKVDSARYEVNPYKLTSNTSYGTVTSSNEEDAYKVFDGNNETSWTSNSEENYILWQMPEEKTVTEFKMYGSSESSKYPKEVELLGSKDGKNYDSLVTSELEQKGLNEYNTVQIETNKYDSYKYFKWKFKNDGNEISINEISFDIYDVARKIFKDSDNITLSKNNFTYSVKNKTSSNLDETEKSLNSYTSNSENMSVTYLNQKVTVTAATPATANIKLGYYNNWSDSSLGTVYIGFSKTNEINKDDFTTYVKKELNNRTEKIENISVKIIEPGEYYLKMILYHNSNSSGYTVYGNIYDLSISKVPTRKQAVLAESTQLGNITSTTGNVILNDENANLVVDQAIINVNKDGSSSNWTNGISNYGILKINEQGIINNNSIYAIGIDNKKLGNILESSGTVNVKKESGYSYGLRNKSKNTDEINGLKFNIVTNSYGILHYASKDLKIKNIFSSGNGTAIYMGSNNDLSLENNNINSYRALVLGEKNGTVNVTSGNYSSTNYTLGIYNNNVKGTININGGIIKSTLTTLYDVDGTFNINGGEITASRYNIEFDPSTQTGTINMNDGQIVSNGDNVHGYSATVNFSGGNVIHKSGNGINLSNYSNITLSNDFSFSKESVGNGIYLNSTGNVVVKDNAKITGDVGIENATNGGATILLKDNAVIDARIGINGRNGGNFQTIVTMGEKDGEVKKDYPKINSKEKAITNSSILNIYDGSLIGLKDNSIGVIVNDSEDNYDLLIQDESDTLEKVTIAIPNLEEFGNVAQIGNTYYPSIKSAVEALSDSEENKITVLKNIKTILSNNIDDLKNCVLDLNGKNIKLFKSTTFITNSGTLKLIDSQNVLDEEGIITTQAGSIQGTGIIVENTGTLVNEGAYITTTGSSTIENAGVVNIISGTIKGYGSSGVIHNSENGEIKITGGKFELLSGGKIIYNESSKENAVVLERGVFELKSGTGIVSNKGIVTINGGEIKGTASSGDAGGVSVSTSKIIINNGTINISGSYYHNSYGASIGNSGEIEINGGNISATYGISYGWNVTNAKLTINGGTINSYYTGITMNDQNNATLIITGGTITSSNGTTIINQQPRSTGNIMITGGTIVSQTGTALANYDVVTIGTKGDTNEDGSLKVSKESPEIIGNVGITNNGTLKFYDGIVKGKTTAISGTINEIEEGYEIISTSDETYKEIKYLDKLPIAEIESTGTQYYNLQEAIDASTDGDTIKIIRKATILSNAETVTNTKNITLDINGYEVKVQNSSFITNSGTLKLIDSQNVLDEEGIITTQAGSIQGTGIIVENTGTLVNEGAYITTTGSSTIENAGVVNIISGTIKGYGSNGVIHNSENGEIKITGGKFELLSGGKIIYNESSKENAVVLEKGVLELKSGTGIVSNKGIVTINGGEIKGTASSDSASGVSVSTSKIIINNGTINISGSYYHNSYGASIGNSGEIEINGGNISATYGISYGWNVTNAKLTINGGTINSYYTGITMNDQNNATLIITGGTITSSNGTTIINQQPRSTGNIMITGGTIVSQTGTALANYDVVTIGTKGDTNEDGSLKVSKESPEIIGNVGITNNGTLKFYDGIVKGKTTAISGTINEIEEGYEIISTSDETYKEIKYLDKLPIAEIESTGTQYYNLQEAIDASTDGDTIKIIRKATILSNAETVTNTKNITLDINGYEVKVQNSSFITNSGTLKLIDSQNVLDEEGIITTQAGSIQGTGIIVENTGTLVNEGAYITTTGSSTIKNTGIFTLESGSLAGKGAIAVLNNSDTGEIKINGGKISGIRNDGSTQNLIKNTSTSNNAIIIEKCVLDLGFSNTTTMNGIETNAGTIKLSNTNITGTSSGRKILGIKALNESKVIYNSGTISVDDDWSADASGIYVEGDVEINGGNIYGEGCGTSVAQAGKLVVNGGVISSHVNGLENNSSNNVIINDGEIKNLNTEVRYNSAILNNASGIITIKGGTISAINNSSVKNNGGTINIEGGTYSSNNTVVNNESGIVNMSNVSIENVPVAVTNNTGTININESVTINASDKAINNTGTGIINIGTKDKQVSVTNPSITGTNYGVYNVNGKINYYDGIITGALNQAIYGVVNEVEPGYKIKSESNESTTSSTLTVIGTDERVAVVNGMNFTNLQEAINACPDNIETDVTLYSNITLNSNILVSANKKIKLYLNGYSITYGDYNFTKEGSLEIITNNSNTVAGNIINTVKDILNISNVSKNIIVYEMDDGSKLDANKEYTLYLNGEKVKMNEEDNLGRYSLGNKEETMKTVRERLYLNKLYEGKYEVVCDDGNKATFWITKEGQVLGTARENIVNEENNLVSSAFAELIITIQTGIIKGRYILLISLISVIMLLLFSIRRQKRA